MSKGKGKKAKTMTKIEAATKGKECTCTQRTKDHPAQIDPQCFYHGGDFGREEQAKTAQEQEQATT